MSSTPLGFRMHFFLDRRGRLLLALAIGLIGLVLRVHMALDGPVEWDEPVYLEAAVRYAQDIRTANWNQLVNSNYNYEHPLLNKLAYGSLLALRKPAAELRGYNMPAGGSIKDSIFFLRLLSLRLFSVGFGVAAVFLLSLINPLAGLFLAVQTYAVKYTSVIYLEALPMFLSLFSAFAFTKFLAFDGSRQPLNRTRLAWLMASGALIGLAAASKYIYGVTGLAVFIYAIISGRKNLPQLIKTLLIWSILAGAFFFLGDPALWANPIAHLSRSLTFSVDYSLNGVTVHRKAYPFWQPLSWLAISIPQQPTDLIPFYTSKGNFWLAVDGIFLPFALLGWYRMHKAYPVFGWWLLVGLSFLLTWNTKWPQYTLSILAPYCLAAAYGVGWAAQLLRNGFSRWKSNQQSI